VYSLFLGVFLLDDWRDDWDRTVLLEVVALLVLNPKQGPL
jgi:hypothetical protein